MTQRDSSENNTKRILILGSAPHTKLVTAYTWNAIPPDLNVADYDVVILDLCPLLSQGPSPEYKNFPSLANFLPLFFSQGSEVIAIGIPGQLSLPDNLYLPLSWWLPIDLVVKYDSGEVVNDVHPEFVYYFRHVKQWFFWVSQQFLEKPDLAYQLERAHFLADDIGAQMTKIAQTRAHQAIAFELIVQAYSHRTPKSIEEVFEVSENSGIQVIAESGKIIWLPPTTEIPVYEAINLLLRERYNLCLEQAPPVWIEGYKLPNQLPIELDIEKYNQEIQNLIEQREIAQRSLQQASLFNRLLYEQGEVLEAIVHDALRELGAKLQPVQPGHEDGRLVDPMGRNGILEIKGLSGSLALKYVRQLDQWFRDAIAEEDWQGKPILIANLRRDALPKERTELFPDNCIRTAKQFGQCLMTTTQLFVALCAHQRGELDLEEFWNVIHNTNGVCSLPELVERDPNQ